MADGYHPPVSSRLSRSASRLLTLASISLPFGKRARETISLFCLVASLWVEDGVPRFEFGVRVVGCPSHGVGPVVSVVGEGGCWCVAWCDAAVDAGYVEWFVVPALPVPAVGVVGPRSVAVVAGDWCERGGADLVECPEGAGEGFGSWHAPDTAGGWWQVAPLVVEGSVVEVGEDGCAVHGG